MKNLLRAKSIEKRKTLNRDKSSAAIVSRLRSLDEYVKSKNIVSYYPLKYEISLLECFKDNKNWFLPRVNGENLEICPYSSDKLTLGNFNIMEPLTEKINNFEIIDMILIPAVASDTSGYRLGYGKGYYDRLLKCMPSHVIRTVIVYSELLYATVYPDTFDEKTDIIVTDKEVLRI